MSDGIAVRARGLTRTFGDFTAVDDIDLEVPTGEIFGFLGPNGCGKTTTIRMLIGLMSLSSGTATVLGIDVGKDPEGIKRQIGYMSQRFSLYDDLTVDENIQLLGALYGVKGQRLRERRDYVLRLAELSHNTKTVTGTLSGGWKQRLALGCAMLHEPKLLFLDEPTGGVDPVARRLFWDILYDLSESGTTIFVTTHFMDEAEYCNRLSIMLDGRIVALGTPMQLKEAMRQQMWRVSGTPLEGLYRNVALKVPGCVDAVVSGHDVVLRCDSAADVEASARALGASTGVVIDSVMRTPATMEDVFMSMIGAGRG